MIPSENPLTNAMQMLHPHFPGGMRLDQMVRDLIQQRDIYKEAYEKASKRLREIEAKLPE